MVSIVKSTTGKDVSLWWFGKKKHWLTVLLGVILILIYSPLCWIRKIETLAWSHVFADVMILITIITIWVYGGIHL
jgi:hypothetical protein